jgi:phage/plasmid-associated DNA primase
MLGKLAVKFSTTLLTGKKTQTGVANPELARAGNGVRWAVMEEPNEDEMISTGTMKALSGNDSYWARDLFESGKTTREIIPLFKLHMICNKLPKIKNADKATWNRIRVIPFEATFMTETQCPDNYDDQMKEKKFPMDTQFTDKIPNMIQPLAWYLIQRWRTLNRIERHDPEKVKIATEMYMQDNDVYKQFEDQCIFEKPGAKMSPTILYGHLKEWYKEEYPGHTLPNRSDVRKHFINKWGELTKNRQWLNKTCKAPDTGSVEDEDDNGIMNPLL